MPFLMNRAKKSVVKRKYCKTCYSLLLQTFRLFSKRNTHCSKSQSHLNGPKRPLPRCLPDWILTEQRLE